MPEGPLLKLHGKRDMHGTEESTQLSCGAPMRKDVTRDPGAVADILDCAEFMKSIESVITIAEHPATR